MARGSRRVGPAREAKPVRVATWWWFALVLIVGACALLKSGSAAAEDLETAAEQYRPYMVEEIDQSLAKARTLRERLAAHDVAGAQQAWTAARVGWERAEVFTSGFVPDLDQEIDAWPSATMGFHAIEAKLFGAGETDVESLADGLVTHLADLDIKVHLMQLLPQRLLNGTARLAYEVGESKADGGESRYSGTSLDDMRNNVEGIDLAYRVIFAPTLQPQDPKLAAEMQAKIAQLKTLTAVPDLKNLDPAKIRAASEEFVVVLQMSAPQIGLRSPTLEEITQ
ncbi:MAG TPA: EfeM/EfeO family lipoprotein [Stellaceae bacterium]|jgi:iron uptake system EfeUOB component EfeO/EfeM|nr:EfeM/EfeO family lipoprotein [Stellaceae bacterium]